MRMRTCTKDALNNDCMQIILLYLLLKVPPAHLLSASVMSAPAAIAIARLLYPETQKSKLLDVENIEFEERYVTGQ